MSENNPSQFIIYQSENGETRLDVRFLDETVWLTQALMAELFGTTPENILMHLKNIYREGEIDQFSTTKDFLVVRSEGTRQVKRSLKHYTSVDYDSTLDTSISFLKTVQNKVHRAITGHTAAEIQFISSATFAKRNVSNRSALGAAHKKCRSTR